MATAHPERQGQEPATQRDVLPQDIIVCYAATPDTTVYPEYVSRSLYSLARSNPGVRVRVHEEEGGDYPYGILPRCIPKDEPADKWVVIMDADTWVHGDLRDVLPGKDEDISLRIANVWNRKFLHKDEWRQVCAHFDGTRGLQIHDVPVYSNGLMACRGCVAFALGVELPTFTALIRREGLSGRVPDPLHLRKREPWWMADQFALSMIVSDREWRVRELTGEEISWNYIGESGGVVHHLGKKANPFDEERWPNFRKGKGNEQGGV